MPGWSKTKRTEFEGAFYDFLNACTINSRDHGPICLGENLYDAQTRFVTGVFDGLEDDKHKFYVLKSRQLGLSTISRALSVFYLGMHDGMTGGLVMDTTQNRATGRREIVQMISDLPKSLGFPRIKSDNRDELVLTNGTVIRFMAAGVKKTKATGVLGRSLGLSMAHLSEICSYENDEGLIAFDESLSDIHPDRLYIYESTARGPNMWQEMWQEGRADPEHCVNIFLGWWSKNSQVIPQDSPDFELYGYDPPTEKEKDKINAVQARYGHAITQEQLAWIRRKMDPSGSSDDADQDERPDNLYRRQEQAWCVTADTRVGTDKGLVPIVEAISAKYTALGEIIHGGPTGEAPIWRVRTKLGYEFCGTANHPLIDTSGNEVRLDSSVGIRVRLQPPMLYGGPDLHEVLWREGAVHSKIVITPDLARFVGLFMGDGSAANGSGRHGKVLSVKITCDAKDRDVAQECQRLFLSVFGVDASVSQTRGWVDVRSGVKHVFDAVKRLNLTRNDTAKTMRRVHVPDFIWRSPRHVIREFLSGLFEADGFNAYDQHRVSLFSKYPDFIRDVQLLLLAFGITSRASSIRKKAKDGHSYMGNELTLRTAEAIKFNRDIGFLSERKRSRALKLEGAKNTKRPHPEICFEDEVVLAQDEGRVDTVWNLTIAGSHLFDANGILTHNTEDDAFLLTGSIFFAPEDLSEIWKKHGSSDYKAYMFVCGGEFIDTRVFVPNVKRQTDFKVWDEPGPSGHIYTVSADVAFGSSERNDRSCVQVMDCYADGQTQVAEYAWPLITTRQFAWVIMAIAGWYAGDNNDVYLIIEVNGPGAGVWDEITYLRHHLAAGYQDKEIKERGLSNILRNVRNYIYSRPDSLAAGKNYHWKTTSGAGPSSKVRLMERCRDFVSNGMLHIRSLDTLQEMQQITREGDDIAARGRAKDDRVVALALGVRAWEERIRRAMASAKRTRKSEAARRAMSIVDQAQLFRDHQLQSFFAQKQRQRVDELRLLRQASRYRRR